MVESVLEPRVVERPAHLPRLHRLRSHAVRCDLPAVDLHHVVLVVELDVGGELGGRLCGVVFRKVLVVERCRVGGGDDGGCEMRHPYAAFVGGAEAVGALATGVVGLRVHVVVAVLAPWQVGRGVLRVPHLERDDTLADYLVGVLHPLGERVECVLLVSANDCQTVTSRPSTEPVMVFT